MVTAEQVQRFLGSAFIQRSLKKLSEAEGDGRMRIDHLMAAYAREEKKQFRNIPYHILLSFLPLFFKVKRSEIEETFAQPFYRKAICNIANSLPEFGLSAPQCFSSPILIVWNFTNICNLRCVHCYQDAHKALPDELTLEERLHVIDEMDKN